MKMFIFIFIILTLSNTLLAQFDALDLHNYLENKVTSFDLVDTIFKQNDDQIIISLNELDSDVHNEVTILRDKNEFSSEMVIKLNELEELLNQKIDEYNKNIKKNKKIARISGMFVGAAIGFLTVKVFKLDQFGGGRDAYRIHNFFNWGTTLLFTTTGALAGYGSAAAIGTMFDEKLIQEIELSE